jgi:phosphoglycolate phosphatase
VWDAEKYYLGRKGDFLAVRTDDPTDFYVIEKGIFAKTYERFEG